MRETSPDGSGAGTKMTLEDPFVLVRGEVQKAVNTARGLYQRWGELLQDTQAVSREEYDWTTNELRNSLRSIEWDLEDLDETISIVESNPRKFKIETAELQERKAFVLRMRQTVKEMKDHITSPAAVAFGERRNRQSLLGGIEDQHKPMDRYRRLDQELENVNSQYVEEQRAQQQLIMEQQDDQLDLVLGSSAVLKSMSTQIGDELEEQAVMLDEFSHELDNTHSRLDSTLKKLAKVSHMTSGKFPSSTTHPLRQRLSPSTPSSLLPQHFPLHSPVYPGGHLALRFCCGVFSLFKQAAPIYCCHTYFTCPEFLSYHPWQPKHWHSLPKSLPPLLLR
ncbi:syntaxin-6-like isoform X1 [Chiloscyllium plagiosum]|uniref:syntaxin-6-like isoform X1 n=1 Tax=Chiloscyllium plagiosum TaxID=36176 RepID=UPI001CB8467A|nr:syntaxin-6-like isoform X1 [Chiloscyllium plagiosum]